MVLEKLHLLNFRNFQDETILFPDKKIFRILGSNGAGKTNLLEAVFILFTTRSFRNKKSLLDCVRQGAEKYFHISADVQGIQHGLTFSSEKMEKSLFLAKQRVNSLNFILGKSILHFSPEESHQFFQSNDFRRSIVDRYISTYDPTHLDQLIQFNHLKSKKVQILFSKTTQKKALLLVETLRFVEFSRQISERRVLFLDNLNPLFQFFLNLFNSKLSDVVLVYRRKNFSENFLDKEILAERVLYGCHKDELDILENGKEVRRFFSNGEKKAINLAFHFSFMEYLKLANSQSCLVCLDDIESELDKPTLQNIHGIIANSSSQFIITSKSMEQVDASDIVLKDGKIFHP